MSDIANNPTCYSKNQEDMNLQQNEEDIYLQNKGGPANINNSANDQSKNGKQILLILIMQIILLEIMCGMTEVYGWFHDVPGAFGIVFGNKTVKDFAEAIAKYNFVGVSPENPQPSFFSMMIEAGVWSMYGTLARSEYYLTRIVVRRREFRLLEVSSKLIGDSAMGVAIAMAVVGFLRSTELVSLTLKTADIGAIGAISFILGFYHENTRHLLGSLRSKISGQSAKDSKDDSESKPAP